MLEIGRGEKFFIVRFVSWNASHDVGQRGLSTEGKIKLVEMLKKYGRVIITSEGELPETLEAYKLRVPANLVHDLLYYADMYVGEGGTMASEAAVLGTPSVLVNTLKAGTFEELKNKYNLLVQCYDDQSTLEQVSKLLNCNNLKAEWRSRQKKFISMKIDATQYILHEIQAFEEK